MLLLITFAIWAERLDRGFPSLSHLHTHIYIRCKNNACRNKSYMHIYTLESKYTHTDTLHTCVPLQASMISWMILIQHGIFSELLTLYAACIQTWHRTHYLNSSLRPLALPWGLLSTSTDSLLIVPLKLIAKVFGVWDCSNLRLVLYCSLVDEGDAACTMQMKPESATLILKGCEPTCHFNPYVPLIVNIRLIFNFVILTWHDHKNFMTCFKHPQWKILHHFTIRFH